MNSLSGIFSGTLMKQVVDPFLNSRGSLEQKNKRNLNKDSITENTS